MLIQSYQHIGMIARWKPVHWGQVPVLHALCTCADHAFIGIGSANRYNARNPFTLAETTVMLNIALNDYDNYTLIAIPDLDNGPCWRVMVTRIFGTLDVFVTANPYAASLLQDDYDLMHPVTLVPPEERIAINGTMVRLAMAKGDTAWRDLVPPEISDYLISHRLDGRFRREFGLKTLALDAVILK